MNQRRVVVCLLALLMPLSLKSRVLSQTPTPQKEVARVAELSAVHGAFQWFQSHANDINKTQMEMVGIPAPPFGEAKRAAWLRDRFIALGLQKVEIDQAGNVVGLRPGLQPRSKLIALTAHIDTVFPPSVVIKPKTESGKMLAPGISDNGAGVMGLYAIAAALKASPVKHEAGILFVGNVGEEGEGDLRGMRYLFHESKWKNQIGETLVLDGADIDTIVTQALGSKRFEITVDGPGGHSWSDFGNPNPIIVMAKAIAKFSETSIPADPKTTFNIGVIEGGTSVNSIPETAKMRVDIRSAAPAEIDRLEKVLRECLTNAVQEAQDQKKVGARKALTLEVKIIGTRPAAELKPGARILSVMQRVDSFLGLQTHIRRASTDANIPLALGLEAVSIGAGGAGGGAHTEKEWYDPTGRDLGLKRILLAVLTLAGVSE
jgi:tripeptide aminopeptidase